MDQQLDLVVRLTEKPLNASQRERALFEFADSTGWRPSDALVDLPSTASFANGHLVAEQGLDRSAVLSFLASPLTFDDLSHVQRRGVLGISYNSLIDWHLFPDRHGLTVVFNRGTPPKSEFIRRSQQRDLWRVESFDAVTGRRPTGNVKALDEALVETVSYWRRAIASELGLIVPNHAYSALFNGLILVRAAEDHKRTHGLLDVPTLRDLVQTSPSLTCEEAIATAMRGLRLDRRMKLIREILNELGQFSAVDPRTWSELVGDFYSNRFAPYEYDFSLISKQALSRVYEKYVSVLRAEHSPQLALFAPLPSESRETPFGEVYTPQYIARFFARFLKDELTPREFRSARIADPACGSGIFLRSVLELQCDPSEPANLPNAIADAFTGITGTDVDPNACFATRLSLSLLHLILTDSLPTGLNIVNAEAIEHFSGRAQDASQFDAVIANPPFVSWDGLTPLMRDRISDLLGNETKGKVDLYIAFLAIALELVKPGGFLMFVVPHSFLLASSARAMRRRLAEQCDVRVLADLSEIPVFEGIGAYVVLLICQKRSEQEPHRLPTIYARIRDFVGHGLQAVLQRREQSTKAFEVYEVTQEQFTEEPWLILPKRQQELLGRLASFSTLGGLCEVQQGVVSGADRILIRPASDISKSESAVWRPLLRDRDMTRYRPPRRATAAILYPYHKEKWLSEDELKQGFPDTWNYLEEHREALEKRAPVRRGNCKWWAPAWPRKPSDVYGRPKILTPYLTITPRFGLDQAGKFAVNRGPMILAKDRSDEDALLKYVAAVLNSTVGFWQVVSSSHKYGRGYAKLEKKTMVTIRIPDPAELDHKLLRKIIDTVGDRLESDREDLDVELDSLVSDAFGLSRTDRNEIGFGL